MGLMDRLRARRTTAEGEAEEDTGVPPAVDVDARRRQLIDLDAELRTLARQMAADSARMSNPGWAGKVADYRAVAAEAAALERGEFDRAAVTDLASQVVPLYRAGADIPSEYQPFTDTHERVISAVDALRAVLPSET